jgi:hypothetical protein
VPWLEGLRLIVLLVSCDIVGRDALVWESDLIAVTNTDSGIVVRFRCVCGNEAEMLTGARSGDTLMIHLESAA